MSKTVTLGGNRLGSGKKQKITMHGFERSTHDLGFVWRNTQAPGTLVPFMNILALPGDTFDINLGADVKTHPTIGPLFGSFKLQLDVFECPIRLYHSWLHNNRLKVGNEMQTVKLPQIYFDVNPLNFADYFDNYNEYGEPVNLNLPPLEFQQINQSSLFSYLGIRGIGNGELGHINANKLAIPLLAYWDIYKNYYANKQEEIGVMIHTEETKHIPATINLYKTYTQIPGNLIYAGNGFNAARLRVNLTAGNQYSLNVAILLTDIEQFEKENFVITVFVRDAGNNKYKYLPATISFSNVISHSDSGLYRNYVFQFLMTTLSWFGEDWTDPELIGITAGKTFRLDEVTNEINLLQFPLSEIDEMRDNILAHTINTAFTITAAEVGLTPFRRPLVKVKAGNSIDNIAAYFSQEGLGIKTYQSDIFNNWLNSEWIEGNNGINEITAVDTSSGGFTIDSLNLAQKVYDMLNRIAVSGGTYEDWMEAVYDHNGYRRAETPMYMGGLSKEIIFQEVVSTARSQETIDETSNTEPLGALGGKGVMAKKHKGGSVTIKVNEPSFIMGIVSITPRIDYSQGNDWTTLLETMDDLHKPNLDEIGFQDLITDQIAFWDTNVNDEVLTLNAAGKQPAWLNYMTNFNKLYGNFADPRNEMFMTLARKYEPNPETEKIKDLTSYIDPTKFNYAFAQTDLSAMNFWVQIGCDITARRKMSAKLMPNL